MIARSESWSERRPESRQALAAAALGLVLFFISFGILHTGPFDGYEIVDTPTYKAYGDAIVGGQVPIEILASSTRLVPPDVRAAVARAERRLSAGVRGSGRPVRRGDDRVRSRGPGGRRRPARAPLRSRGVPRARPARPRTGAPNAVRRLAAMLTVGALAALVSGGAGSPYRPRLGGRCEALPARSAAHRAFYLARRKGAGRRLSLWPCSCSCWSSSRSPRSRPTASRRASSARPVVRSRSKASARQRSWRRSSSAATSRRSSPASVRRI